MCNISRNIQVYRIEKDLTKKIGLRCSLSKFKPITIQFTDNESLYCLLL